MKKHHAIAMALSALSAGFLISCAKPADESKTDNSTVDKADTNENSAAHNTGSESVKTDAGGISAVKISPEAQKAYLTHVANEIVIPAYQDAVNQSNALHDMAVDHCSKGEVKGEQLQALRAQWLKLAQAWAAAEMINFGPATQSMTNLYINYYPDERGLVHQGVADLISANPTLTPDQLASESAIVQGVPGLEEALYSNDSLNAGQCAYVISASQALSNRLKDIEKNWQGNSVKLLAIDKTDSSDQGLNQWINSLLSLIETLKSSAVDQPLGLTTKAKGHVPAMSAGQSRAIINAKLDTLNQALTDPVLTAMLTQDQSDNPVGDKLSTALSETTILLAQMPEDISKADKATQQKLYDQLTTVTQIIKRELIPTLGLRVGFNSTDGD